VVKNNFHLERKGNGLVIRIDKHPKDVLDKFIANVKQAKASDGKPKQSATPAVSKPLPKPVVPAPAEEEDSPVDKIEPVVKSDETKADILREPVSAVPAIVEKNVFETKAALPVKAVSEPEKAPDFLKYKEPVATEPPSLLASGWKMLYTLALVLALMFFIFYVFKKVVLKNSVLGGNDRLVKVLSTGYLGPKKTIALVDVAGEVLVLGISDGNITLLTQIHDEEQIEKIKGGNTVRKVRTSMEERPIAERHAPTIKNDNPFSKYIKQFSSDVESVQISSAASVAELIRKNREKIKAAS
jgi:flagellar protein FliO/FliZ